MSKTPENLDRPVQSPELTAEERKQAYIRLHSKVWKILMAIPEFKEELALAAAHAYFSLGSINQTIVFGFKNFVYEVTSDAKGKCFHIDRYPRVGDSQTKWLINVSVSLHSISHLKISLKGDAPEIHKDTQTALDKIEEFLKELKV